MREGDRVDEQKYGEGCFGTIPSYKVILSQAMQSHAVTEEEKDKLAMIQNMIDYETAMLIVKHKS